MGCQWLRRVFKSNVNDVREESTAESGYKAAVPVDVSLGHPGV
jgi:hypothetical protein